MKRIAVLLVAVAAVAGVVASTGLASGHADKEAAPIFGIKLPHGYRDWRLISVAHEEGNLYDLRAILTKEGSWPGIQYPHVPGHEVAGIIDEVGAGVSAWKKGQRVGVGWHGGQDNTCRECRRGDFRNCQNLKIPGISYDGGYQQYMIAPVEALAAIPETLSDAEAAPLLCAGITTHTHYGTVARCPATLSRCRVSEVWVISEFNLRASLAIKSRLLGAGRKTLHSQRN
jgi:NADPH:quinone reductase-like Zn-dependent oxidoreductase